VAVNIRERFVVSKENKIEIEWKRFNLRKISDL
jgi:hypothetical protein